MLPFPLPLWANLSHGAPLPPQALENGVARRLHCRFIHRQARTILKTYSEFLFPDGSNDTNFELTVPIREVKGRAGHMYTLMTEDNRHPRTKITSELNTTG